MIAIRSIAKDIWDTFTVLINIAGIFVVWIAGGVVTLATVALLIAGVYWLLLG